MKETNKSCMPKPNKKWYLIYDGTTTSIVQNIGAYATLKCVIVEITANQAAEMLSLHLSSLNKKAD